jgi:hypothetical protein
MNNIEQRKALVNEVTKALCNLANIAQDWNDAQEEPDERGRGNGAIGLVVFEDGSGYIAEFDQPLPGNSDPFSNGFVVNEFSSPEELEGWLLQNVSDRP